MNERFLFQRTLTTDNMSNKQVVKPSLFIFIIFILSFHVANFLFANSQNTQPHFITGMTCKCIVLCSFCKPAFSGATFEWDTLYYHEGDWNWTPFQQYKQVGWLLSKSWKPLIRSLRDHRKPPDHYTKLRSPWGYVGSLMLNSPRQLPSPLVCLSALAQS
jgi:hypothetical protein